MKLTFKKEAVLGFVNKYFVFLTFVIVLLVVAIGVSQLIYPLWNEVQAVDVRRADEKEKELKEAQNFETQLKQMRDKYQQIDYNDIRRLDAALPKSLNRETLFLTMQNFGKAYGFSVRQVDISTATTATAPEDSRRSTTSTQNGSSIAQIKRVNITISLDGVESYQDFKQLLRNIETHVPILTLQSVSYPIEGSVKLNLTSYYLDQS
jgi:hypothetical protein